MGYKPEDETKNAFVDGPETRGVVREEVEEEKEEIERVAKLREHVLSTKKGWIEWRGEEQGELHGAHHSSGTCVRRSSKNMSGNRLQCVVDSRLTVVN